MSSNKSVNFDRSKSQYLFGTSFNDDETFQINQTGGETKSPVFTPHRLLFKTLNRIIKRQKSHQRSKNGYITGIVSDSRVSLELLGISFGSWIRSFWAWHTTPDVLIRTGPHGDGPSLTHGLNLFLLLAADVLLFALDLEGFRLGLQGCGRQFRTSGRLRI